MKFSLLGKKFLSNLSFLREILGERVWGRKHKAKPGRAQSTAFGPTDIYEIDSTPETFYLLSELNRCRLIGTPVVYRVVDRFSTCIVGFHAALEGPSWDTARLALYCAFTDKVEYLKRYGITIRPEDWPCQELCYLLPSDQGSEVIGRDAKTSLQTMLNIIAEINGVACPERKGTVENTHKAFQDRLSWMPGAWRERAKNRQERLHYLDKQRDAALTLREFVAAEVQEIIEYNNNDPVTHLLTREMREVGVRPYRRDIYLWGLTHLTGEPRRSADLLRSTGAFSLKKGIDNRRRPNAWRHEPSLFFIPGRPRTPPGEGEAETDSCNGTC